MSRRGEESLPLVMSKPKKFQTDGGGGVFGRTTSCITDPQV